MNTPVNLQDVVRRLRCGNLVDGAGLFDDSPEKAVELRNRYLLSLHISAAELQTLSSDLNSIAASLTVVPSPADVMYAVVALQHHGLQWRLVVPLWSELARDWFEEVLGRQSVTLAANVLGTSKVAFLRWGARLCQAEVLLHLAQDWPELADADRLMDTSLVINAVAQPSFFSSLVPSCEVEEVQVVTNCAWLSNYTATALPSPQELAEDAKSYAHLVC